MPPLGLPSDMGPDMPAGRGIGDRGKALCCLQSPEWSVRTRFLLLDSAAKRQGAGPWTQPNRQSKGIAKFTAAPPTAPFQEAVH